MGVKATWKGLCPCPTGLGFTRVSEEQCPVGKKSIHVWHPSGAVLAARKHALPGTIKLKA